MANRRPPDLERQLLRGCGVFLGVAVVGYVMTVWPWLIFDRLDRVTDLARALAVGFLPACALGAIATRRAGAAGACGLVGVALAVGVFLYLRLGQLQLAGEARQARPPEYPAAFGPLIAIGVVLFAAVVAVASLPRQGV